MTADIELHRLTSEVSALQKDMAQIGTLVDRLDITIEKLTEVSSTVSQLLAVHGNRLETQEKIAHQLQGVVEKRREETENYMKDLHSKIEKVERDLEEDMEVNNKSILNEIRSLKLDSEARHREIGDRMNRLEKWMWIIMGGGVVLAFLVNKINIPGLFT